MTDTEREALLAETESHIYFFGRSSHRDIAIIAFRRVAAECRRLAEENAALRAAVQRWDARLSEYCDGPERDAVRAALSSR